MSVISGSLRSGRTLAIIAISIATAVVLVLAIPESVAMGASARACVVRNVTRGGSYPWLGAAVREARAKDKLTVRGTCKGSTRIRRKSLTIVGIRKRWSGPPTLQTNGWKRPLAVQGSRSTKVTLKNLTLKGAPDKVMSHPGGIEIDGGVVTLRNVTVKGFKVHTQGAGIYLHRGTLRLMGSTRVVWNNSGVWSGGGIYNEGTVVMSDTSQVSHNHAGKSGGGIYNVGVLIMKRSSSVRANTALLSGSDCAAGPVCGAAGGIWSPAGTSVTMQGQSSVSDNVAGLDAGGIWSNGTVLLRGSSSVSHNEASRDGGGIIVHGKLTMQADSSITGNSAAAGGGVMASLFATLTDVVCAPPADGANVFGNTPDNCESF